MNYEAFYALTGCIHTIKDHGICIKDYYLSPDDKYERMLCVMSKDKGLDYLLDLDGEILAQDKGCWIKIEARQLEKATRECPHGVKYCLTLHDRYGKRLLGFDNAHMIKTRKRGRFTGRRIAYDHKHMNPDDKGVPYVFESAEQLLTDFFIEVDKVLKGMK